MDDRGKWRLNLRNGKNSVRRANPNQHGTMIGPRTSLSLVQYLELHDYAFVKILFEKHRFTHSEPPYPQFILDALKESVKAASQDQLHALLNEIVQTKNDLRTRLQPRYRHDERFDDLERCLFLDGYSITNGKLIPQDPAILDAPPVEDDLVRALQNCGLTDADAIVRKLNVSTESFRRAEPNFNASLTDARIALQTLAASIAKTRQMSHPGNFDEASWGSVLAYLRSSEFVTEDQEKGLAGVFRFVSPGAHLPLGLSEMEMTRLGRSFVLGMCWFLVKRFTA
jgi:hypothetical protein